jgi:indole-3-glycerol phosphate synthase
MNVLDNILASTRTELMQRKRTRPESELRELALAAPAGVERGLREALNRPGIGVIAEFKRSSPSAGTLREGADLAEIARAYERSGAAALSVLTEGPNFDGSLDDLRTAREACELPVLRKDFIVDPYQLYEARLFGADAVLLIVAALIPSELRALRELARGLRLDVLVEVHDAAELRVALDTGADLIGINNRDLRDFSVDVERTFALLDAIPTGMTVISESGIGEPEQLARLQDAGVAGVLVGESLMRAPVPEEALRALRTLSVPADWGEAGRLKSFS